MKNKTYIPLINEDLQRYLSLMYSFVHFVPRALQLFIYKQYTCQISRITLSLWQLIKKHLLILLLLLSALSSKAATESQAAFRPYFVATKSKDVNLRAGPNVRYPVVFKLTRKFEPLKVINKFEHWRQVEDSSGDKGWIHVSNLTAKKIVKTKCTGQINLYHKPEPDAKIVAHITNEILFRVLSCNGEWCKLERDEISGWLEKRYLWGAIENE